MSTLQNKVFKKKEFVERFVEICGSSKPAEISKILNISYQASKNYLSGKVPNTQTLITISSKTSCSIDWLLLGEGKKFINSNLEQGALILSDELKAFIREECRNAVVELIKDQTETTEEKVYVLRSEDIKEEKALDKTPILPLKNK